MAAFYREHGRVVLAQVLLVTGERVLAEEIVQDTMLDVWRGAGSFRGESTVRSWVIATAWRKTRERLRGRWLRGWTTPSWPINRVQDPGTEVTALDRAELAEVTGAIRELAPPPGGARPRFGAGLSLPEVAAVLEIPGRDREEPPLRGADRAQPDSQGERTEPMNTTRFPHLDLADLIGEATGHAGRRRGARNTSRAARAAGRRRTRVEPRRHRGPRPGGRHAGDGAPARPRSCAGRSGGATCWPRGHGRRGSLSSWRRRLTAPPLTEHPAACPDRRRSVPHRGPGVRRT